MKNRLFNKMMVFLLILSMNFICVAAIVSDNDGSAFVTKAEFDSLKSNFGTQIGSYNNSIDRKIDGAIANYLSGLKLQQEPKILWDNLKLQMGDVWLSNKFNVGKSTITTNKNIILNRHFTLKKYNNLVQVIYLQFVGTGPGMCFPNNPSDNTLSGAVAWWINNAVSVGYHRTNGAWNILGSFLVYNTTQASSWFITKDSDTSKWQSLDIPSTEAWNSVGWNRGAWDAQHGINDLTTGIFNHLVSKSIITEGEGSYYEYYVNPVGNLVLRNYYTNAYPVYDARITAHTYKDFTCSNWSTFQTYYATKTGKSDNTALSYTLVEKDKFGEYVDGDSSKVADNSTETLAYYSNLSIYQVKTSDLKDYSIFLVGNNSNENVYCLNSNNTQLTVEAESTINSTETKSTFTENQNLITGAEACEQDLSGCELKYKPVKITPEVKKISSFVNEYVSNIAGETVHLGGGIPIVETLDDEQRLNVRIKFKSRTSSGVVGAGQVHYELSDKQFTNCAVSTGATSYATGTVDVGDEVNLTFDTNKKGNVWINFYSTTDGYDASIEQIKVSVS